MRMAGTMIWMSTSLGGRITRLICQMHQGFEYQVLQPMFALLIVPSFLIYEGWNSLRSKMKD